MEILLYLIDSTAWKVKVLNSQKRSVELVIESPTLKLKPKWNQTRLTYFAGMHFFIYVIQSWRLQWTNTGKTLEKYTLTKYYAWKNVGTYSLNVFYLKGMALTSPEFWKR